MVMLLSRLVAAFFVSQLINVRQASQHVRRAFLYGAHCSKVHALRLQPNYSFNGRAGRHYWYKDPGARALNVVRRNFLRISCKDYGICCISNCPHSFHHYPSITIPPRSIPSHSIPSSFTYSIVPSWHPVHALFTSGHPPVLIDPVPVPFQCHFPDPVHHSMFVVPPPCR